MSEVNLVKDKKSNFIKMSVEELQALLEKQRSLLSDKRCVGRLPDKGAKIKKTIENISTELSRRSYLTLELSQAFCQLSPYAKEGLNGSHMLELVGGVLNKTNSAEKKYLNGYDRVTSKNVALYQCPTHFTPSSRSVNVCNTVPIVKSKVLPDHDNSLTTNHPSETKSKVNILDDSVKENESRRSGQLAQLNVDKAFGNTKYKYDETLEDLRAPAHSIKILDFSDVVQLHQQSTFNQSMKSSVTLSSSCDSKATAEENKDSGECFQNYELEEDTGSSDESDDLDDILDLD